MRVHVTDQEYEDFIEKLKIEDEFARENKLGIYAESEIIYSREIKHPNPKGMTLFFDYNVTPSEFLVLPVICYNNVIPSGF